MAQLCVRVSAYVHYRVVVRCPGGFSVIVDLDLLSVQEVPLRYMHTFITS